MRLSPTAKTLLSLYIPSMIMSFGQGMVVPTIPVLARTFDVSIGTAAQAVTAQLVARVVALTFGSAAAFVLIQMLWMVSGN